MYHFQYNRFHFEWFEIHLESEWSAANRRRRKSGKREIVHQIKLLDNIKDPISNVTCIQWLLVLSINNKFLCELESSWKISFSTFFFTYWIRINEIVTRKENSMGWISLRMHFVSLPISFYCYSVFVLEFLFKKFIATIDFLFSSIS